MTVFLGMIMVFVTLLYPGANAAWSNLETTIQSPPALPTFPTFQNPNTNAHNLTIPFIADGPIAPDSSDCSEWYVCLNTPAQGQPGVTTTNVTFHGNFSVVLGSLSLAGGNVQQIQFNMWCKNNRPGAGITGLTFNFTLANGSRFYSYASPTALCAYGLFIRNFFTQATGSIAVAEFNNAILNIDTNGPVGHQHDSTTLAFLSLTFFFQGPNPVSSCAALDFGCAFMGAANIVLSPILTFINGVIYVVQAIVTILIFIGSVFVFVAQILVGVMLGLFASFLYFFNLPGAPTWVQGTIDAIFVGFLVILGLAIADRAIGLFGGAVNKG